MTMSTLILASGITHFYDRHLRYILDSLNYSVEGLKTIVQRQNNNNNTKTK